MDVMKCLKLCLSVLFVAFRVPHGSESKAGGWVRPFLVSLEEFNQVRSYLTCTTCLVAANKVSIAFDPPGRSLQEESLIIWPSREHRLSCPRR